jgi:hypothetical protein
VRFRSFDRAVKQYRAFVELLRLSLWEDAVILLRSLYELNLNLSEILSSAEPERTAERFVKFGKFQKLRLERHRVEDRLSDLRSEAPPRPEEIDGCERELAGITSNLDREFAQFRRSDGKWNDSWSGASVETLAQRLGWKIGGRKGQNDYFVFRLASLYTHNSPGSLFLVSRDVESDDWLEFSVALAKRGHDGIRRFLYEGSICLVDIVEMAGPSIAGYDAEWFDRTAPPLLATIDDEPR